MPTLSTLAQIAPRGPEPIIQPPLTDSSFKLDFSGIAGFFGGDSAWKALATTYILRPGTPPTVFLGYYNSPGAYEVVRRCAPIANSRFWDSIFPGDKQDAAEILGLEGKQGPPFLRSSGRTISTGHPAYLIAQEAQRRLQAAATPSPDRGRQYSVTVVNLVSKLSSPSRNPMLQAVRQQISHEQFLRDSSDMVRLMLLWGIPAYGCLTTCIICALVRDWWCFASILVGIFAGALIRLALCNGTLKIASMPPAHDPNLEAEETEFQEKENHPSPHQRRTDLSTEPAGGVLLYDQAVIVLRGNRDALFDLTRGRFCIEFEPDARDNFMIGLSALVIQFLTQILLIPQGTLFGQLMFVTSLGVSAIYNIILAMRQDALQTQYLFNLCGLDKSPFKANTMSSKAGQAVFACLALRHLPEYAPRALLDRLIPEQGGAWRRWKCLVARKLESRELKVEFSEEEKRGPGLNETEQSDLSQWLGDAEDAYCMQGWQPESAGKEKADHETGTGEK